MDEKKFLAEQVRGQPRPSARGGLPHARFDQRGRRRRAGNLAAAEPLRYCRGRKPRRLADDGGRPRLPRHAARAQIAARGADGPARARARRATMPTSSTTPRWRIRSARRCWWCWKRWRRPNGWPSCCTTCSRCRSRRSRRSSAARRPRHGSSPAAPAAACRARRRSAEADLGRQRKIVDAFLAASRGGDFEGLLAVLDPDVVFRADPAAQRLGSLAEIRGAARGGRNLQGPRAGRQTRAGRRRDWRLPSSWAGNCASCCASRSAATGSQRWKRWPMPGRIGSTSIRRGACLL